jgi:hypothetical protein
MWQSRPPRLPWRQERRARHIELVDWYPVVLDETSRTPTRSPAVGSHLLQLTLPADQVIGGTGVTLCGDPGWTRAAASPRTLITPLRDSYPVHADTLGTGVLCDGSTPGRKQLVWYAEGVTSLIYALSPNFRYEEGDFLGRPVRALYERGVERTWGAGLASRRTETALAWTWEIGGQFPWPHFSVIQGLDRAGKALPMVLLTDVPTQSAILHLVGLAISQQMLIGGTRMFTVGAAAFQTTWFFETLGRRGDYAQLERQILDWDLDELGARDEPIRSGNTVSPCVSTFCRRSEFMSHQLRWWAGNDDVVRKLYGTLITRFLMKPTVVGGFQQVSRELIIPDPSPLYLQLPRGGTLYDDAITDARRQLTPEGKWLTTAVVKRREAGLFPQTVWVIGERDTVAARAQALLPEETLTVITRTRPRRVVLDPLAESHDWNMLNNQRLFSSRNWLLLAPHRPIDTYLDTYFTRRSKRDRLTLGVAPTAWYNDAGGWTVGGRVRQDYLGRFELNELWASIATEKRPTDINARLRIRNPVWLRAPGWSQGLDLAWVEGRASVAVEVARRLTAPLVDSTVRSLGVAIHWMTVTDTAYLEPRAYDNAGTAEIVLSARSRNVRDRSSFGVEGSVAGGYAYAHDGAALANGLYARFELSTTTKRNVSNRVVFGARIFAGAVLSADSVPRQRRFFLSATDPYRQFDSPFLRSRGSILARRGTNYHQPGGVGVRAADPRVSSSQAVGCTLEVEYAFVQRNSGSLFKRIALGAFVDGGIANGDLDAGRNHMVTVGDAGPGFRIDHRIGRSAFQTRFDLPIWMSRPDVAQYDGSRKSVAYRWTFSLAPVF